MSELLTQRAVEFVPDVIGSHTTQFRAALPHSEEFIDEGGPDGLPVGIDPRLISPEDQIRMEVERELREQMQGQLNAMQEDVDRRFAEFAAQIEAQRQEAERELCSAAAELALAAARRVVRSELKSDPDTITRVVEEAVAEVVGDASVQIRLHPLDAEHMRTQPDLLSRLRITEIIDDPSLEAGGCMVESANREWDSTLQTRLTAIDELVRDALERT